MAIIFHIPGVLRDYSGGLNRIEIAGSPTTVGAAFLELAKRHPGVYSRVLNEQGKVRDHVNVFVGDEHIRYTGGLGTRIESGCEIYIIPAISGG